MTVSNEADEARLTPTYLFSDPLADLVLTVVALLRGAQAAQCAWQEEPGEYRWVFHRADDSLEIRLLWFQDIFSRKRNEDGQVMIAGQAGLRDFAKEVRRELNRLSRELGTDRYKSETKREFPMREYERLNEALRG